ncbi:Ketosteroid isomerase homolog [Burkholderia sp. GAS332]|nr:Ketosteroid isomerase homolog [Burkholderia sp. GAS332]
MSEIESTKAEIRAKYDFFEQCVSTRNVSKLLEEFYSKTAVFAGNGGPTVSGQEELGGFLTHVFSEVFESMKVEQIETRVYEGNVAFDSSLVSAKYKDGAVGTLRTFCVFRKIDGEWFCDVDIALNP